MYITKKITKFILEEYSKENIGSNEINLILNSYLENSIEYEYENNKIKSDDTISIKDIKDSEINKISNYIENILNNLSLEAENEIVNI